MSNILDTLVWTLDSDCLTDLPVSLLPVLEYNTTEPSAGHLRTLP